MSDHDVLVWGPRQPCDPPGPRGWVACCSCGWVSNGHASEQGADDAGTLHVDQWAEYIKERSESMTCTNIWDLAENGECEYCGKEVDKVWEEPFGSKYACRPCYDLVIGGSDD